MKRKAGVNIGDCLDHPLAEKIGTYHKVLGCGTVFRNVKRGIEIWGSGWDGFRDVGDVRPGWVHAVRGPLTGEKVIEWKWKFRDVYGDPGILLPKWWPQDRKTKQVGWVPHFKDDRLLPGALLVSPKTDNVAYFVKTLTRCREIYSSSLHGLIIADAYGIPSCWVVPSWANATTRPWEFKYHDYYASIGCSETPVMLGNGLPKLHPIPTEMQESLIKVCPWRARSK